MLYGELFSMEVRYVSLDLWEDVFISLFVELRCVCLVVWEMMCVCVCVKTFGS